MSRLKDYQAQKADAQKHATELIAAANANAAEIREKLETIRTAYEAAKENLTLANLKEFLTAVGEVLTEAAEVLTEAANESSGDD